KKFRTGACHAVQTVDVLCDDSAKFSSALQLYNRCVNFIGACISERFSSLQLVIPMLDPRGVKGHEILEINRLSFCPDSLRPTEIRNSARCRNAGACENEAFF